MNRTPAQLYCLVFGALLTLSAVAGFGVDHSFSMSHDVEHGTLLGLFDVNGWHNLIHLVSGVAALAFSRGVRGARTFAFVIGAVYAVVTIMGLAYGEYGGPLSMVAMNPADNFLHLAVGACGLFAGTMSSPDLALAEA
jgi:hypothetical protein